MNKLSCIFAFVLLICASCEYSLESDAISCEIDPSEFLLEKLVVRAKCLSEETYHSSSYTCYEDVLVQVLPVFDDTAFEQAIKSNEQLHAFYAWGRGIMKDRCDDLDIPAKYTTSFLSGKVLIEADKSLFGEEPETNISSHFRVVEDPFSRGALLKSSSYSVVFPSHGVNRPVSIDDYFFDGFVMNNASSRALVLGYYLCFKDIPDMRHKDITLSFTFPVHEELRFSAYQADGSFSPSAISYRDRELRGSVQLSFSEH